MELPAWSVRRITAELERRESLSLYRRRRSVTTRQGGKLGVDGKALLNFSSNDYLGLAGHPELEQAFIRGAERWGVGAGAAHLVNGHTAAHHALEEELADFLGYERVLLFSTGYMANMGVINALVEPGDLVLEDSLNHASLLDGGWLSRAEMRRLPHADMAALDAELQASKAQGHLVVSDGVFSMDGELAPLNALIKICRERDALLMIDDAHGIGPVGASGRGILEACDASADDVPVLIGTLGKAFGTAGAFCAGSEALIEFLIQRARTYIYTTAMPAAVAEASRKALQIIQAEDWRREHLADLIAKFRSGAEAIGLELLDSPTPIQPVIVGSTERAMQMGAALEQAGCLVTPIRPPTVPAGSARLRVTLTANHSHEDVGELLAGLASAWSATEDQANG